MVTPLLATKLFLPPARPDRVQRPRLFDRLDELMRPGVSLGLISAPAGFGKTSLAEEWAARREKPVAWLSLDAGDNDPTVFLAYLLAALERARPGAVPETTALARAPEVPPTPVVLATLLNELARFDPADPLVMVLDDLQFVESAQVQESLAFVVEHLPPGARLLIATRADPALPLARMRARRQLVELRSADLRFTSEEARAFLARSLGEDAASAEIESIAGVLATRTEGWAAGLQMAALALQSEPGSREGFVQAFSGSHRFVLDYLAEEVLSRRPQAEEQFLLQTSLLERFNAALCSAETGLEEAECRRMLEAFEAGNLFLIPLDSDRVWFRYHYLFADLLRARLKQSQPRLIATLHRRASNWFESAGLIGEGIRHALAAAAAQADEAERAADYEHAARMVEGHTFQMLQRGEMRAMLRWVGMLPAQLSARRPWLCVYRAWTLALGGEMSQVEGLVAQAESQREPLEAPARRALEGNIAAIRAYIAMNANRPDVVLEQAQIVRALLPETDWATGFTAWNTGYTLRTIGRLEEAARAFEDQLGKARAGNDPWGVTNNATDLGQVRRMQGRLKEALEIYQRGLEIVEANGARKLGYVGRLLTAYAAALYEQNRLDEAEALLNEAVELNRRWQNANHEVFAAFNLTKVLTARGKFAAAETLMESALRVVREQGVVPLLKRLTDGAMLTLRLAQGKVPPPAGPLEDAIQAALAQNTVDNNDEASQMRNLLYARVLLSQARPAESLHMLEPVEAAARASGRGLVLIEALALKSLALHRLGQSEPALAALNEAAATAGENGAVRTIIDAAPLIPGALSQMLLALIRETAGHRMPQASRQFLAQLRSALEEAGRPEAAAASTTPAALIEPLSERELEVLRLLAEGLTNPQIAARLVISTGTVKAHTAAIFRKLDANTRTQAVAKAREARLV